MNHYNGIDLGKSAFLPPGKASTLLGVPRATLILWAKSGTIDYVRKNGKGTKHFYDVRKFLQQYQHQHSDQCATNTVPQKSKILYARVSTRNQADDLERQKLYLTSRYPGYELVSDIGSGINWKRPGLISILDRCVKGEVDEVVVAHPDRLARLAFELVRYIIEDKGGAKLVILNNKKSSPNEELVTDLLNIITVFSARANGLRKYRDAIKKDFDVSETVPS